MACRLGSALQLVTCPSCGKRVAIFYVSGKYFACLSCCGLGYASQKWGVGDCFSRLADKHRKRLWW